MGDGETGVRGREGALRDSEGLVAALMLRESFGLAARVASILVVCWSCACARTLGSRSLSEAVEYIME